MQTKMKKWMNSKDLKKGNTEWKGMNGSRQTVGYARNNLKKNSGKQKSLTTTLQEKNWIKMNQSRILREKKKKKEARHYPQPYPVSWNPQQTPLAIHLTLQKSIIAQ